jgi:hypothetical protein
MQLGANRKPSGTAEERGRSRAAAVEGTRRENAFRDVLRSASDHDQLGDVSHD